MEAIHEPLVAEEVARHVGVAVVEQDAHVVTLEQLRVLFEHVLVDLRVFFTDCLAVAKRW